MRVKENHKKFYNYDEKEDQLGEGGYASVYKAILKETGEKRALKIININKIKQELEKNNFSEPTEEEIKPYIDGFYNEIKYSILGEISPKLDIILFQKWRGIKI